MNKVFLGIALLAVPKVYTNADLERLPPLTLPRVAAPAPPTQQLLLLGTSEVAHPQAELRVARAEADVAELEARLRAVHNPFLPRPVLPAEEALIWQQLDGVGRARRVEAQLSEARAALDLALEELARSRR